MSMLRPVASIAQELGVDGEDVTYYGKWKAKVSFSPSETGARGKLILITGITPTPQGEGKTVTSIGVAMGLNRLGKRAIACIRQPSLGPVFGIKGGGAGGGRAVLEPMQEINMRLTGDFDAIAAAHNLLAAMVDNHVFHGNDLKIDPSGIVWPRTLDVNDRALRELNVGLGPKNGVPHQSRFVITAASEIMAVFCLSLGYSDLKDRLGRIIVAYTEQSDPVTAGQLRAVGSMAALLRDALDPNLVQTSEGTPALVHGGPFGNIAHGTCSLLSIQKALELGEYAVVEAGFGSDLGAEKFVDIVSVAGNLKVDTAVLVATVRGLKYQGGLDDTKDPDARAVEKGLENLEKHVENVRALGVRPVVAINRFSSDSSEELAMVRDFCASLGVPSAPSSAFLEGGQGCIELAQLVVEQAGKGSTPKPLYSPNLSAVEKVEVLTKSVYGGNGVNVTETAENDIALIERIGLSRNPVCVAKTAMSLSDDQTKRGRPRGFAVTVRRVQAAAGAGFNVVHMGDIQLMPGLPKVPAAERIALSDDGVISGVF
jgi:formate--tetrahydrofolate ligase